MTERILALAGVVLMLSACSGGGTATSAVAPAVPRGIVPTSPGAAPSTAASATLVQTSFTFGPLPAGSASTARRPNYVTASVASVKIALDLVNGSAPQAGITTSVTTNVSFATCPCTVSGPAVPAGSDEFTLTAYDAQSGGGNVVSTATPTLPIVADHANSNTITLNGVPASFTVSPPSATLGTAFASPQTVSVTVKDADGNTIMGAYANPVTLSDSDSSGATALATSGSDNPGTDELLSSSDAAMLSYTGASIASAAIGASATGASSGSGTFAPAPTIASIALANAGGTSESDALIGAQANITLTGDFVSGATTLNVSGSGVTISGTSATATSLTATLFIDPEAATGNRNVTVSTTAASSAQQTLTISSTGVDVVTLGTDTTPGTTPGACPAGASGDLRYALCNANAGDTIVFDTTEICAGSTPCTITLAAPLPPIVQNQTIDGGQFERVIVDGASAYRAFFVAGGTVTLANLQVQDARAQGGNGGGGGAGLGGGLFVYGGTVAVTNDYFLDCAAAGGNGTVATVTGAEDGGGGLGGSGGTGDASSGSGGGGGGVVGDGGNGTDSKGGHGGYGGGGGGGFAIGGSGGTAYFSGAGSGTAAPGTGAGGAGGFGGGGGGGGGPGAGGGGGFGGGGGGGDRNGPAAGGNGEAGGGGGYGSPGGNGGALSASLGGGAGGTEGGGGGAAAGPAIFVSGGTLTTTNSGASGSTATAGAAGGSNATPAGMDQTPVFVYAGTVNGTVYTAPNGGPVAGALTSTAPQGATRKPLAVTR